MSFEHILAHILEHIGLVAAATGIAVVCAVPCAIILAHTPAARVATAVLGALYTVPSLAYFAALVPLVGLGTGPALLVLATYAFVLCTRSTIAGLENVPASLRESAAALGLGRRTIALRIELPLAAPAIVAGLRTTIVIITAMAAIAAWVDGGGLGVLLFSGLRQDAMQPIILGSALAAALAISADYLFSRLEIIVALDRGAGADTRTE